MKSEVQGIIQDLYQELAPTAPNHRNRESTSDGRMVNNDYSGGLRC
ncbi:hypothetical protein [Lactiplantibacillus plantarum]